MFCGTPSFQFYAGFYGSSGGGNPGCTTTTSGQCTYYACNNTTSTSSDDAGTVFIQGGGIPANASVTYSTTGYQYSASGTLLTPGQTFSMKNTGGAVPPFGVTIVAPSQVALGSPPMNGGAFTISTAGDLTVTWSGGQSGNVMLFEGAAGGGGTSYFTCEWDATAGKATVPKAVLAPLAGQSGGYLLYGQMATSTVTAGPYSVQTLALPYSGGSLTFK